MFDLDGAYEAYIAEARAVAERVEPFAAEADELSELHPGIHAALAESDLWGLVVPAAYGGRLETIDALAVTLVREVLVATSAQLDSLFALQGIGSFAIASAGSEAQRQRWLPAVAGGEVLAALALTEPVAGSDLKSIVTELVDTGGELRLEGAKSFISNGGIAGFYTVLAREGDGYTLVLVPADSPGLTVEPTPEIIAPHVLGEVRFDRVALPPEARIGPAGAGFAPVLATLAMFRVSVAGAALGVAQEALEEAARHAAGREQFGRPLARHGAVAQMLAQSWSELEAARLLTYRAAARAREDPAAALDESSMAKLLASEVAGRVVDRAVQISGRFGLVRGSKIERLYRTARPMRIYEGASEVLELGIARALTERLRD